MTAALIERTKKATKENLELFDMTGNSLGIKLTLKRASAHWAAAQIETEKLRTEI